MKIKKTQLYKFVLDYYRGMCEKIQNLLTAWIKRL